jgi:hypothetical protein
MPPVPPPPPVDVEPPLLPVAVSDDEHAERTMSGTAAPNSFTMRMALSFLQ